MTKNALSIRAQLAPLDAQVTLQSPLTCVHLFAPKSDRPTRNSMPSDVRNAKLFSFVSCASVCDSVATRAHLAEPTGAVSLLSLASDRRRSSSQHSSSRRSPKHEKGCYYQQVSFLSISQSYLSPAISLSLTQSVDGHPTTHTHAHTMGKLLSHINLLEPAISRLS